MSDWTEFEAIAKGEALAMAENAPPLQRGQYVAWVEHAHGLTDSLSAKHMAGANLVTLCGQIIPPPADRLAVVYKTLKICGQCAIKYAKLRGGLSA